MATKRKHVVFEDDPEPERSQPRIHPDRSANIGQNVASSGGKKAVDGKSNKRTLAKQRYLVKKAKRHRKLSAAKKASAPKNKQWQGGDDDGPGDDASPEDRPALVSVAPSVSRVDQHDEAIPPVPEAGPSNSATRSSPGTTSKGKAVEQELDDPEAIARQRRFDAKRAKREARQELKRDAREKARARKREQGVKREARKKARLAAAAAPVDAAGGNGVGDGDEGESGDEEDIDIDDNVADFSQRADLPNTVGSPDPLSPLPLVPDDALINPPELVADPAAPPPRQSPPPLIPFPLPTPAPKPSAALLARQGLPAGLEDAVYVDQDLRVRVEDVEILGEAEAGGWAFPDEAEDLKQARGRISERMSHRLKALGIEELFAVQAALLPHLLSLKLVPTPFRPLPDYLVSAPTGSGKTLAYAIPLIEVLRPRIVTRLRALVVLPTRELVVQVRETMEALAKGSGLKIGSVTGQHSFAHEQAALIAERERRLIGGSSKIDILIATPGRLMDHLNSTPNFSLQHLRFLVVDEADRLLNQSFQDWLAQVLSHIDPPTGNVEIPEKWEYADHLAPAWMEAYGLVDSEPEWYEPSEVTCQKLLFSATLTRDPAKVAALSLRYPKYFIVQSATNEPDPAAVGEQFALPSSLSEKMLILPPTLKPLNLLHLIHSADPSFGIRSALVFTKSVDSAERLVRLMEYFEDAWTGAKLVVKAYTGEMKPGERRQLLDNFAKGAVDILVCSDLIARGMDLPTVAHVVSYDIPLDMRKYVHRVGRTARAGREGTAWSLVEKQEAIHFKAMLKGARHGKRVKKVKVKEEELVPYRESYEIAVRRMKAFYGREG